MRNTLIILLVLVTGCTFLGLAESPTKRLAAGEIALETTVTALCDIREAGKISDDRWDQILIYIDAAHVALKDMRESVAEEAGDFETAWSAFSGLLDTLMAEEAGGEQ